MAEHNGSFLGRCEPRARTRRSTCRCTKKVKDGESERGREKKSDQKRNGLKRRRERGRDERGTQRKGGKGRTQSLIVEIIAQAPSQVVVVVVQVGCARELFLYFFFEGEGEFPRRRLADVACRGMFSFLFFLLTDARARK